MVARNLEHRKPSEPRAPHIHALGLHRLCIVVRDHHLCPVVVQERRLAAVVEGVDNPIRGRAVKLQVAGVHEPLEGERPAGLRGVVPLVPFERQARGIDRRIEGEGLIRVRHERIGRGHREAVPVGGDAEEKLVGREAGVGPRLDGRDGGALVESRARVCDARVVERGVGAGGRGPAPEAVVVHDDEVVEDAPELGHVRPWFLVRVEPRRAWGGGGEREVCGFAPEHFEEGEEVGGVVVIGEGVVSRFVGVGVFPAVQCIRPVDQLVFSNSSEREIDALDIDSIKAVLEGIRCQRVRIRLPVWFRLHNGREVHRRIAVASNCQHRGDVLLLRQLQVLTQKSVGTSHSHFGAQD